jgi:hypothetical protein
VVIVDTLEDIWNGIRDAVPGNIVGAILILIIGWIVARLLSSLVERGVRGSGLERRLGRYTGDESADSNAAGVVGQAVFYLIMLFVVITVLDVLNLELATEPMGALLSGIFGFIPNIIAAVVLLILAVILAKIVRAVVFQFARSAQLDERLRAAEGRDAGAQPAGEENVPLSRGLSEAAFVLVFLVFLPAILGALQLGGLLEPVNVLLTNVFGFIPNLVAAALILVIAWFLARILARIVTNFLSGAGFDELPARLGFGGDADAAMPRGWTLSRIAGTFLLVVIMWFAVVQALEVLRFEALAVLAMNLLELAGRILLGLIIIAVGLWLARGAARAIRSNVTQQPNLLALVAQVGIILLFGAMGLRQMGVADSIINLAFAILFGAVGVAVAIAFGVGGRGAAGRLADRWVAQAESGELDNAARPAEGDSTGGGTSTV